MEPAIPNPVVEVSSSSSPAAPFQGDSDSNSLTAGALPTPGTLFPGSPFPQPSLLKATPVAPPPQVGDRDRSTAALAELRGSGPAAQASLPAPAAPPPRLKQAGGDGASGSPAAAGRKRSQPTGGWGWPGDGASEEDAGDRSHKDEGATTRRGDGFGVDHNDDTPAEKQRQPPPRELEIAGEREGGGTGAGTGRVSPSGFVVRQVDTGDDAAVKKEDGQDPADGVGGDGGGSGGDHDVGENDAAGCFSLRVATVPDAALAAATAAAAAAAAAATATATAAAAAVPSAPATVRAVSAGEGDAETMTSTSCLLGDFNFSGAELDKMSKRYATVNSLGAETPMPLLDWLIHELDMDPNEMRNLILRHPRLMAYRVTSHVAPKTKWLRERLGLGQAALRKLVTTYPAVLSRSVENNLEPKFKWLEERLGATQEEVSTLIKRFPLIFGYSTTENLEPTVAFFTGDLCGEQSEIKSAVMSCPSILSRSLDKRMVPRTQRMRDKEIEPRFGLHKWVVSTYTDKQFTRWLQGRGT